MVELQTLRAVGNRKQQASLPAAYLAAPLAEPTAQVGYRKHGSVMFFQKEFLQRLRKKLCPGPHRGFRDMAFDG